MLILLLFLSPMRSPLRLVTGAYFSYHPTLLRSSLFGSAMCVPKGYLPLSHRPFLLSNHRVGSDGGRRGYAAALCTDMLGEGMGAEVCGIHYDWSRRLRSIAGRRPHV